MSLLSEMPVKTLRGKEKSYLAASSQRVSMNNYSKNPDDGHSVHAHRLSHPVWTVAIMWASRERAESSTDHSCNLSIHLEVFRITGWGESSFKSCLRRLGAKTRSPVEVGARGRAQGQLLRASPSSWVRLGDFLLSSLRVWAP